MIIKEGQDAAPQPGQHLVAYSVQEFENAEGKKARAWTRIGAAFPHKDGTGFNIQLRCLPLDGQIVLFPASDEARDDDRDAEPARHRNDNGSRTARSGTERRPR